MQQITALLVFVESTVPKCCRTKAWLQFLLLMFFFAFLLNFLTYNFTNMVQFVPLAVCIK